jgi:hypothetical protein
VSGAHPRDLAASVRQRLYDLAKRRGEDLQLVTTRFALERFLYRLSCTRHAERFILKGAMLFAVWSDLPYRPTRDVDFLGIGDSSGEGLAAAVREIFSVPVEPDGLLFDAESIRVEEIREAQEYPGQRVKLRARLGDMLIPLQVDVGFGDAVTPGPVETQYPTLLEHPGPRIRAYPPETVVAEKLQAMVALGMVNSRMKDFYDLWVMTKTFTFQGTTLVRAIRATFQRRRTALPKGMPTALSDEFAQDADKVRQWRAFVQRTGLPAGDGGLVAVIADLREFLLPPLSAAAADDLERRWRHGEGWL